jgi:hypothetical protein
MERDRLLDGFAALNDRLIAAIDLPLERFLPEADSAASLADEASAMETALRGRL